MKLSENFSKEEFDSKDGSPMPRKVLKNIRLLVCELQYLRDHLNSAITVNSGYRSNSHNEAIGGSVTSQHLLGKAADIAVDHLAPTELYYVIESLIRDGEIQEGGLGLYNTFVHYDIRDYKARWDLR